MWQQSLILRTLRKSTSSDTQVYLTSLAALKRFNLIDYEQIMQHIRNIINCFPDSQPIAFASPSNKLSFYRWIEIRRRRVWNSASSCLSRDPSHDLAGGGDDASGGGASDVKNGLGC